MNYDGDLEDRLRTLRTESNAQIILRKTDFYDGQIFDATTPENTIPLTDLWREQAQIFKDKVIAPDELMPLILNPLPFTQDIETFYEIVSAFSNLESKRENISPPRTLGQPLLQTINGTGTNLERVLTDPVSRL